MDFFSKFLSYQCPSAIDEDGKIYEFNFDLHCDQIYVKAEKLYWDDKLNYSVFRVIEFRSTNIPEYNYVNLG